MSSCEAAFSAVTAVHVPLLFFTPYRGGRFWKTFHPFTNAA